MTFGHALLLLLLLLLPLLWWRRARQRRRWGVAYSSIGRIEQAGTTWAVRARWLPAALRSVALALLIVCVARPRKANEETRIITEGVAILLVVDRSESMLAEDFKLDGRAATRLDVVKRVVEGFVEGGDTLPGRPDDLIGLISFATFADTACPLTLDHDHLVRTLRDTEVSEDIQDRATAIGDSVALGVERIRSMEQRGDLVGDQRIRSRVMILLTDGENTAGDIDPVTAAEMAAAFGIKVYTIGAGTNAASAPATVRNRYTGRLQRRMIDVNLDEETLRRIAEITGGEYYRAMDAGGLESIYARIDELERTKVEQHRYTEYRELALEGLRAGPVHLPPLLAVVFVALAIEIVLANSRLGVLR